MTNGTCDQRAMDLDEPAAEEPFNVLGCRCPAEQGERVEEVE